MMKILRSRRDNYVESSIEDDIKLELNRCRDTVNLVKPSIKSTIVFEKKKQTFNISATTSA